MDLMFILSILIVIGIIILIIKTIKKIIVAGLYVLIVVAVIFAAYSYFGYNDIIDLDMNFASGNKVVLLEDDGQISYAMDVLSFKNGSYSGRSSTDIKAIDKLYQEKDMETILGDNYKVIVFKSDLLGSDEIIEYDGEEITLDSALGMLKDPSVSDKAVLFSDIINYNAVHHPVDMSKAYKDEEFVIYPKTMLLKVMDRLPWMKDKIATLISNFSDA